MKRFIQIACAMAISCLLAACAAQQAMLDKQAEERDSAEQLHPHKHITPPVVKPVRTVKNQSTSTATLVAKKPKVITKKAPAVEKKSKSTVKKSPVPAKNTQTKTKTPAAKKTHHPDQETVKKVNGNLRVIKTMPAPDDQTY
jgi:hypothetical protein